MVVPGTYTVSLVIGGNVVDSKPLRLVQDPEVQMTESELARYFAVLSDLHEAQRKATDASRPLTPLYNAVLGVGTKVDSSSAPANVKSDWAAFRQALDSVRMKFGVGAPAGGPGGGGGGGFAAAQAAAARNVLGRLGTAKAAIMGMSENPSEASLRQASQAREAVNAALPEVGAIVQRARSMAQALAPHGITLTVPNN
jgi:hypothetical protein